MFDNLRKLLGRSVEAGAMQRPQGVAGGMGAAGAMRGAMDAARGAGPRMAIGRDGTPLPAKAMIEDGQPGGYALPEQLYQTQRDGSYTPTFQGNQNDTFTMEQAQQADPRQAFRQPGNSLDALRKLLRF